MEPEDPANLSKTGYVMRRGLAAGGAQADGAISESGGFWQEALARSLGSLRVQVRKVVWAWGFRRKVLGIRRVLWGINLPFSPKATTVLNGDMTDARTARESQESSTRTSV